MQTPEETVSRITGACLPHLWEGRCVRHHSIIHPDNDTCVAAQDAAGFIRKRDAEGAAKALREAVRVMRSQRWIGCTVDDIDDPDTSCTPDVWIEKYADRIERETGESGA